LWGSKIDKIGKAKHQKTNPDPGAQIKRKNNKTKGGEK